MNDKQAYDVIVIGGFGRVGLPFGIFLANAGFQVALYDIDNSKRSAIENGKMPFLEHGAEPILQRVIGKSLHVASSLSDVENSKTIIITVGTPVDEYLNPDTKQILHLADELYDHLNEDHCVILRSTVYSGASERLFRYFLQRGKEVDLAYCPERIVQGYALDELGSLPQIVSGVSEKSIRCATGLFKRLGVETIETSVKEAEFVKLFSNAWRYIHFSIANQFYMIASEQGADFNKIYEAMTRSYDRAKDFPRPGFTAGPCLLKDTLQLAASYGNHFHLGHAAMMVNEGLPGFLVSSLINDIDVDLSKTRVGILGMAFKADTDDIRDSLSYKLLKILKHNNAQVKCSDEYVKDEDYVSKEELIATCSIIIVCAPHSQYKDLTVPKDTRVIDLWGVVKKE